METSLSDKELLQRNMVFSSFISFQNKGEKKSGIHHFKPSNKNPNHRVYSESECHQHL